MILSLDSAIAQLVEYMTVNHGVPGSNPGRGATIYKRSAL